MKFLSRLFGGKITSQSQISWPNDLSWGALRSHETLTTVDGPRALTTVACGDLHVMSGRLSACDPFVFLEPTGMPYIDVPKGKFPVIVTLADVSEKQDGSHIREAYASIVFAPRPAAYRRALPLTVDKSKRVKLSGDEFIGFGVDAGTACFVDESVVASCMPDPRTWHEDLFENTREDCWFRRMDDPNHIREGIANITLPLAKQGENLILFHSGWGDGHYPIVGSFDSSGELLAAHIDFFVVK